MDTPFGPPRGNLTDVSDIYFIFSGSGAGKRKEASEQVVCLLKVEREGGVTEEDGGGDRCRENVCKEGGGLIFFFGAEVPTKERKGGRQAKLGYKTTKTRKKRRY